MVTGFEAETVIKDETTELSKPYLSVSLGKLATLKYINEPVFEMTLSNKLCNDTQQE